MESLSTLLGSIRGIVGKSFLQAGLLPSGFVLLALLYVVSGPSAIGKMARSLTAADAVMWPLTWFALGLIFYALRTPFLAFLEQLPGPPPLSWLRKLLENRNRRISERCQSRRQSLLFDLTVHTWYSEKRNFARPKQLPLPSPPILEYNALTSSSRARHLIERVVSEPLVGPVQVSKLHSAEITMGLRILYEFVAHSEDEAVCKAELEAWRTLVKSPAAVRVLNAAQADVYDEWIHTFSLCQRYPERTQMQPTRLGNRITCLDEYGLHRYGIETSLLWLRLSSEVSAEDRSAVSQAQLTTATFTNLMLASFVLAILFLPTAFFDSLHAISRLQFRVEVRGMYLCGAMVIFAWVFYGGALYALNSLEEHLRRITDLNRLLLITRLGYVPPKTVREELDALKEIRAFLVGAKPRAEDRELKT